MDFSFFTHPQTLLGPEDAQVWFEQCMAIAERDGIITAEAVVADARDPTHPLHGYFEWDDRKAADKYRLWQAQHYLREVHVVVMGREPVRAFYNVSVIQGDRMVRGYLPFSAVLDDDKLVEQVKRGLLRDLESAQRRCAQFDQLERFRLPLERIIMDVRETL